MDSQHIVTRPAINSVNPTSSQPFPPPIFIHSSFRTSSTWLWGKLRSLPNIMGYYEIFHETLEDIDSKALYASSPSSWASGHPAQAPYFLEFLPLLKEEKGVNGYDAKMSFDWFIPRGGISGDISVQEKAYINLLVEQAYRSRKIPLLSDTRSIGRMAAIKKAMPVNNVLLYRNLFHQWGSYSGQSIRGNKYFIDTIEKTALSASRNDKFINGLIKLFPEIKSLPSDESTFLVFIIMHLYLYANAIDSSDIIIDVNAIASDYDVRRAVESELSDITRCSVDLSDVNLNFDASILLVNNKNQFIDTIEQFSKIIASTCESQNAIDFLYKMKDETLSEWERHDGASRNTVIWFNSELSRLQRDVDQKQLDHASVASECDHLGATLAETVEATSIAEAAVQTLTTDRDQLGATLAETAEGRSIAEAAVQALTLERDQLGATLAETVEARSIAESAVQTLMTDRDQLGATLAETVQARSIAEAAVEALTSESDQLGAMLAETVEARSVAEGAVQALTPERDQLGATLAETVEARSIAEAAVQALTLERDQLGATLAETAEARSIAEAAVQALTSERDQLGATLAETAEARSIAEAAVQALTSERDQLGATLAEAAEGRSIAESALQALTTERDRLNAALVEAVARSENAHSWSRLWRR